MEEKVFLSSNITKTLKIIFPTFQSDYKTSRAKFSKKFGQQIATAFVELPTQFVALKYSVLKTATVSRVSLKVTHNKTCYLIKKKRKRKKNTGNLNILAHEAEHFLQCKHYLTMIQLLA